MDLLNTLEEVQIIGENLLNSDDIEKFYNALGSDNFVVLYTILYSLMENIGINELNQILYPSTKTSLISGLVNFKDDKFFDFLYSLRLDNFIVDTSKISGFESYSGKYLLTDLLSINNDNSISVSKFNEILSSMVFNTVTNKSILDKIESSLDYFIINEPYMNPNIAIDSLVTNFIYYKFITSLKVSSSPKVEELRGKLIEFNNKYSPYIIILIRYLNSVLDDESSNLFISRMWFIKLIGMYENGYTILTNKFKSTLPDSNITHLLSIVNT